MSTKEKVMAGPEKRDRACLGLRHCCVKDTYITSAAREWLQWEVAQQAKSDSGTSGDSGGERCVGHRRVKCKSSATVRLRWSQTQRCCQLSAHEEM